MSERHEVFIQFIYKGKKSDLLEDADRIADTILTDYPVEVVSVKVESLGKDDN